MVYSKEDIVSIIRNNRIQLKELGAKRIGLFGSHLNKHQNEDSDIDLLVEFEQGKKNFKTYTGTYLLLKELLHKEIDFLTPESLSPYIGPRILKSVEYVSLDN